MTAEFDLTLLGYCGMPIPIKQGDREDVRQAAARLIRRLRGEGFPVVTLEAGEEWEVQEPDGCCLVPAYCGILRVKRIPVPTFRCRECGEDVPEGEICSCHLCCECMEPCWECSCRAAEEEECEEEDCCEEAA